MTRPKYWFFLVAPLFMYCDLAAQTGRITGKVWNAEANAPLPGASVVITETGIAGNHRGPQRGAGTDVEGQFFLAAEKGRWYTLTVSGVGFATRRIDSITADGE